MIKHLNSNKYNNYSRGIKGISFIYCFWFLFFMEKGVDEI